MTVEGRLNLGDDLDLVPVPPGSRDIARSIIAIDRMLLAFLSSYARLEHEAYTAGGAAAARAHIDQAQPDLQTYEMATDKTKAELRGALGAGALDLGKAFACIAAGLRTLLEQEPRRVDPNVAQAIAETGHLPRRRDVVRPWTLASVQLVETRYRQARLARAR